LKDQGVEGQKKIDDLTCINKRQILSEKKKAAIQGEITTNPSLGIHCENVSTKLVNQRVWGFPKVQKP